MSNDAISKNILKYFYLLDPDALSERIVTKLEEKNFDFSERFPQKIFPIIYHEITEYCRTYTYFVISPDSFNSPDKFYKYPAWETLIDKVLQNHCILNGFITSLETENNKSIIKISGANDLQLRTGYFKTNCFSKENKPELLPNGKPQFPNIHQRYNQHKKYWNNGHSNTYSYQYLKKYSSDKNSFIDISPHNGNWGCFIYTNPVVRTVNSNIDNSSSRILTNYNMLYEECLLWIKENDLSPEDRFLFEHAMESMYGFSFFSYVAKLLGRIHSAPYNNSETTLNDLEGSVLLNYIQKIAQLPIIYNRSVFLEYVIQKIVSSRYLNSHDYTPSKPSLFSNISSVKASKEQLITSGFELAGKYLQKLKYVTIPLLEDMWNVTIYNLNKEYFEKKGCPITAKTYQAYLKRNYFAITQDYSYYFDNNKSHNFREEFLSQPDIKDIPHLYQKANKNDTYVFHSKYEHKSFDRLLYDYFKIERFSIPKIVDLLLPYIQPNIPYDKISSHTNELNFHKSHSMNIFSFAETIPSSS